MTGAQPTRITATVVLLSAAQAARVTTRAIFGPINTALRTFPRSLQAALAVAIALTFHGHAWATSTSVSAPTLTYPPGFDIPTMFQMIVTNNAAFIFGGVGFISLLWIIGRVIRGLRGNIGRIAGR